MKSHVLSDEQTHLKSEENRMRQIQKIQANNQSKLDSLKKGKGPDNEYMTFSKFEMLPQEGAEESHDKSNSREES